MRRMLGLVTCIVLTITACVTFQNTPMQTYTWAMVDLCNHFPTIQVERVEADGRYWYRWISSPGESGPFNDCMKKASQEHPYLDWIKTQKPTAPQTATKASSPGPLTALQGTAVASTVTPTSSNAAPAPLPVWKPKDEWQYAYKGPTGSGTYVWAVDRIETLSGVQHYVIRTGSREIFLRTTDIATSLERVEGVVVRQMTPPRTDFSWPLAVGKSWELSYKNDEPANRQTFDRVGVWTVEAEETVTVPAGTFQTLKLTSKNKVTGAIIYEQWYAPDVKQWVKIRENLTNGVREREMLSFKLN